MVRVLQRDDAESLRKGIGESGHETVGDVGAERCAAEDVAELVSLAGSRALPLGLAAPVQHDQRNQEQQGRDGGRDQRELQEEAAPGVGEQHRARPVDHDRPAGDRGGRVGDGVIALAVQADGVRADAGAGERARQREILRPREAAEDGAALAVEDDEAGVAEVECSARDHEGLGPHRGGQHAGHAPARVARGHGHDDHVPAAEPAVRALAHERRFRRFHVPDVGAAREIGVARLGSAHGRDPRHALAVDPGEPCAEQPAAAHRLEPREVAPHRGGVALHDRGRAGDRAERRELPAEVGVDHAAGQHGPRARVAECRPLGILVLPPGQRSRDCDEQQDRQQSTHCEVPAIGDAAAGEDLFDVRARCGGWSLHLEQIDRSHASR